MVRIALARFSTVTALILVMLQPCFAETCTYTDWAWHVETGKAVNITQVKTSRDHLGPDQFHPELPCSICAEDMETITLPGVQPFQMCRVIAPAVKAALSAAQADGFPIEEIIGYRVGRSKGPINDQGLRTQYSHHSFGLALDINPPKNGLYDQCPEFGPDCRLRIGGAWQPGRPGTVSPGTLPYIYLTEIGMKWGGELPGQQKDFMHFSLSGD